MSTQINFTGLINEFLTLLKDSLFFEFIATWHPYSSNFWAIAKPIPDVDPVIKAFLFCKLKNI